MNQSPTTDARLVGVRVCHITTAHGAFDDRVFHKECRALVEAGCDVHLIVGHDRDEVVDGVHIHALPRPRGRLWRMLGLPWLAYRKVLSLRPRPAICHFHDPELLAAGMTLKRAGFTVVYDVHENVAGQIRHKPYLPRWLRGPMASAYTAFERVAVQGLATVHVLDSIARNYPQPRVVVRNLPRLDLAARRQPRRLAGRVRLVYVGSVSVERGALTMIQLADRLVRRGVDFELRIVGQIAQPLLGQMQAELTRLGLAERVVLTGFVSFEQAQREVADADIGLCLLHPTPNYLNSLAVKIFEYMAQAAPVVASDFACWREYVRDTGAGVQVDPLDVEATADAVVGLLADPEQLLLMGQAGRAAVEREFCWEAESRKLMEFYRRLLSASVGGRARSE